jgi:hypothetical protein
VESTWLMRCYDCGVAITPPDGYRGEVPGVARGQGREVAFRAGGVGPGRVVYVFVLCPLCHHRLRSGDWGRPADDHAGDGAWRPLLPMALTQAQAGSGCGRRAPPDRFSSASYGGPRSARGVRPQVPAARQGARGGTGSRHFDHGTPLHHLRLAELVVFVLCVVAFAGMVGAAILIQSHGVL